MRTQIHRLIMAPTPGIFAGGFVTGCLSTREGAQKEVRVTVSELSAPARAAVAKVTAGGHVDQIDKEVKRGRTVYDAEATVRGRHPEFLIADSDREVLGTEVPIEFSQLPQAVQPAAANTLAPPAA